MRTSITLDQSGSSASFPSKRNRALERAVSIADLRDLAARRLPKAVFDFIDGGAGDEITLRDNQSAFGEWRFLPHVAVDVSCRSIETAILGRRCGLPMLCAPTGLAGFFWPHGEIATARAAAAAGIPYILSTNSVAAVEEVAAAVPGLDLWFQLYFLKDRVLMDKLIARARAAGCRGLCVTVDLALQGRRERDLRNAFTMPLRPTLANALDLMRRPRWLMGVMRAPPRLGHFGQAGTGFTSVARHVATLFDPSASWEDVARLRERWPGPLAIKGVLHPDDAVRAVEIGADAVIVSNHGGRQLDRVPAAITALPGIAAALHGRAEIIVDGGVRRGADIAVALALGAEACSLGRALLWGLSAGGEEGVRRAIAILREELDVAMALLGTPTPQSITAQHVQRRR